MTGGTRAWTLRFLGLTLPLLAAACVADLAQDEPFAGEGSPRRGRIFAQTHCASCHAIDAKGESPYAPAPPFRDLPKRYAVEDLAESFAEGIDVGHRGEKQMPEFVLDPLQIEDLIAYLNTLKK